MSMTFRVGQPVVYVDDIYIDPFYGKTRADLKFPKLKRVYTVREICPGWFRNGDGGILLNEIKNPLIQWRGGTISELPFWIARFRPAVKPKTMEIFTAMLSPSQVTVDAMNIDDCGREMVR